ncbi:MAG: hypothetical protein WCL22_06395, partial [bacterium]
MAELLLRGLDLGGIGLRGAFRRLNNHNASREEEGGDGEKGGKEYLDLTYEALGDGGGYATLKLRVIPMVGQGMLVALSRPEAPTAQAQEAAEAVWNVIQKRFASERELLGDELTWSGYARAILVRSEARDFSEFMQSYLSRPDVSSVVATPGMENLLLKMAGSFTPDGQVTQAVLDALQGQAGNPKAAAISLKNDLRARKLEAQLDGANIVLDRLVSAARGNSQVAIKAAVPVLRDAVRDYHAEVALRAPCIPLGVAD